MLASYLLLCQSSPCNPEYVQVCYTWWCLSALSILGRLHWLDAGALQAFILSCQVRLRCSLTPVPRA